MQFPTQKVDLTNTLRFSFFTCNVHWSHFFTSITILVFPSHSCPECGCCPFTACDTFLGCHQRGKQQICVAQSNTKAKEDPTCSADFFLGKISFWVLHLWILCHQIWSSLQDNLRSKNEWQCVTLFECLQQQGMVPKKPSFLSFFCPLEGKLTN